MPALAQRRRTPRAEVRRTCRVILADRSVTAVLEDVSRTGVGLSCKHLLPTKTILMLELEDGRRLNATVVRQNQGSVGLLLDAPLPLSDPLFRYAKARAKNPRR